MNRNGFTLVELLFVIAIIGVITTLTIPTFKNLLLRNKVDSQAHALFSIIYLARSEAIKRSDVVTICKSSSGSTCGGSWSEGWLMFADNDADGSLDNSEMIVTHGSADSKINIRWIAFGSNNYIRFTPRGMTLSQNGTFTICATEGNNDIARTVVVSKLARVRMPPAGKAADGGAIKCI